jgi:betaine reductase
MTKEFERAGIPTVLICTIVPLAQSVGANRIVAARAVTHPLGNPLLPPEREREFRRQRVRVALESLTTEIHEPLVVGLEHASVAAARECGTSQLTASRVSS